MNQWKDGTTAFYRCAAWRTLAEHVADSLMKGSRVVASGRMRQHDWTTDQGEKRSMLAVEVDDIGASIRFTTVTINAKPAQRSGPDGDSPWTTTSGTAGSAQAGDEPPFELCQGRPPHLAKEPGPPLLTSIHLRNWRHSA